MTMEIQHLMWKIEGIRDAFMQAVFVDRDLDAALAPIADDCVLETVAGAVGATGTDDIRRFLAEDVLAHLPDDLEFARVSKTSDQRKVAHEMRVSFTHDRELPWLLPGVPPTGRRVEVSAVSVGGFKHTSKFGQTSSRMITYRITWDRLVLLERLGLVADRASAAPV